MPLSLNKKAFIAGLSYQVPVNFPGSIPSVTWSGNFYSSTAAVSTVSRQWAAAVYSSFGATYGSLGVKPVDGNTNNPYLNADLAGTPENYKAYLVSGAKGTGGTNYTGTFSPASPLSCAACLR